MVAGEKQADPGAAPDADAILALARAALDRLPDAFASHIEGVVLRVDQLADDATLDELGIDDPFALTGLYTGRPLTERGGGDTGALPDMIHLYRRAILDEWIETGVRLDDLVAHVVIHEIGHHFGLSDDDMAALEEAR